MHPSFALRLLFQSLGTKEFAAWSMAWFVELLVEPIIAAAAKPSLVLDLTMKTVFEKEDNAMFHEPVLIMQLAAQQLWACESSVLAQAIASRRDAFLAALGSVVENLASVQPNPFDMHLWGDLFGVCFGALCALNLLARSGNVQAEEMRERIQHAIALPHLLKAATKQDMFWLL